LIEEPSGQVCHYMLRQQSEWRASGRLPRVAPLSACGQRKSRVTVRLHFWGVASVSGVAALWQAKKTWADRPPTCVRKRLILES